MSDSSKEHHKLTKVAVSPEEAAAMAELMLHGATSGTSKVDGAPTQVLQGTLGDEPVTFMAGIPEGGRPYSAGFRPYAVNLASLPNLVRIVHTDVAA